MEELFKNYFAESKFPNDRAVLIQGNAIIAPNARHERANCCAHDQTIPCVRACGVCLASFHRRVSAAVKAGIDKEQARPPCTRWHALALHTLTLQRSLAPPYTPTGTFSPSADGSSPA